MKDENFVVEDLQQRTPLSLKLILLPGIFSPRAFALPETFVLQ
jgi:hypothetical protein